LAYIPLHRAFSHLLISCSLLIPEPIEQAGEAKKMENPFLLKTGLADNQDKATKLYPV
jgi:hypothetical protein